MTVVEQALAWFLGIVGVIYIVGLIYFGRRHYARRHGVGINELPGDEYSIGSFISVFVGLVWPIAIFSPEFRNPQPCTCPHHVLARQEQRLYADSVRKALRQEQEEGW